VERIISKLIEKFSKYHRLVLLVFMLVTISLVFVAKKITINSDLMALLPDKNPSVKSLKKVINSFGGEGYFIVVLEYAHPFKPAGLKLIISKRHIIKADKILKRWDSFPFRPEPPAAYIKKLNDVAKYLNDQKKVIETLKRSGFSEKDTAYYNRLLNRTNSSLSFINDENKRVISYISSQAYKKLKKNEDADPVVAFIKEAKKRIDEIEKSFDELIKDMERLYSKPDVLKTSADKIAKNLAPLKKEKIIKYVDHKYPVKWIKDRLMLLMDLEDLNEVYFRIRNVRKKNTSILSDSEDDLTFSDIAEKYDVSGFSDNDSANKNKKEKKYKYFISPTGDVLLLLIKPSDLSSSLSYCMQLHSKVDNIIKNLNLKKINPNISYGYTGRYEKKIDDAKTINEDIKSTSFITFGIMGIIILILFRRLGAVLLVFLSLASGIIWAIAFLYLTIGYLNIITAFLIAILSGLGIDFNIHFLYRYYEERRNNKDMATSLAIVYKKTLPAIIASCTTTAIAFLCLVISPFKGFSHFGLTIAVGLVFILMSIVILFPTLIYLIEKMMPYKPKLSTYNMGEKKKFPAKFTVLFVGVALTVFSIFSNTSFDFNMNTMRNEKSPSIILDDMITRYFRVALWPAIGYTKSTAELDSLQNRLRVIKKSSDDFLIDNQIFSSMDFLRSGRAAKPVFASKLDNYAITFASFQSIRSFYPANQDAKFAVIEKIRYELTNKKWISKIKDKKLLKRIEDIKKYLDVKRINSISEVHPVLKQRFINPDNPGTFFFYIYPKEEISMSEITSISRYAKDLTIFMSKSKKKDNVITSETIIFSEIIRIVKRDAIPIVLLTLFSIFAILLLDLRKISAVFYVLLPLIVGIIWILGIMRIFKVPFTYFNIAIVPTLIGIGIDDGIHLYHRFKEEKYTNLLGVIKTTGMAMFFTSFTTAIGFGSLIFAKFKGLRSIGWLALIGITTTFVVTVTVLPALLQIIFDKKNKKNV
jgi:predicted RND superfamily exporter protein